MLSLATFSRSPFSSHADNSAMLPDHAQGFISLFRHVLPLSFAYAGNGCWCVQTTALLSLRRLQRFLS